MGATELGAALDTAGFRDVAVETKQVTGRWESADEAFGTVYASLYGPPFVALSSSEQVRVRRAFAAAVHQGMSDGQVAIATHANIGTGVKER